MFPRVRPSGRAAAALLAAATAAAALSGGEAPLPEARADVPAGVPTFTDPLEVDNPWFPLRPGSLKVYSGRERGDAITVVENHLGTTRTFSWNGLDVPCRTVQESVFVDGVLHETSWAWFAQADDGSVYTFGEISLESQDSGEGDDGDGEPDEEDYGWVVGALAETDPEFTAVAGDPAVFMPALPEPGDVWKPEDLFPVVDETDTVLRAGVRVGVPAGWFHDCIEVEERTALDPGSERKWYAAGVGAVKAQGKGERVRLQATTIGAPDRPRRRGARR